MIFFFANKLLKLIMKLTPKREYRYTATVSEEDAIRNINYLAHSTRKIRYGGAGVPLFPILYSIKHAYRTVLLKEKGSVAIFAFEKWLKENYRLILSFADEVKKRNFALLPHAEGAPRVIVLADFIVKCSDGRIDRQWIESIVSAYNHITPLTFAELECLKAAIAYRLLYEISVVAEKCAHYYVGYLAAKKDAFRLRYASKDSYLYYFALFHPETANKARQTDFRSARIGFENVLAANETLISAYIDSLRNLPKALPTESYVRLSKINEIYSFDEDYRSMSDAARKDYLHTTYELSRKYKVAESVVANAAVDISREYGMHFGKVLYKQKEALAHYLSTGRILPQKDEGKRVQGVYCTLVIGISVILAFLPAFYVGTPWAYLVVLPFFIAILHPVEYMLKRFLSAKRHRKPLAQMDYDVLPDKCSTVVVVSRFIASEKDVDDAVVGIETLAASFRDEKVSYAVVADFPSAVEEETEKDQALLAYIGKKQLSENVGFYVRKRVFNGEKWVAYERKRGALLQFLRAVENKDFSDFSSFGTVATGHYAILLDDDSEVLPGTLRSAVLAMSHPLNEEYELMSFGGKVNRYSLKTYYSEKFERSCGIDAYPFYSDFYSDRFDCALYCGKAIVRIAPYVEKLTDFFPDNRILSHDIIEGAVLRSTSLKRCVYEDAPITFASDYARSSRWQRGDVQLLPYALCNRVKNRAGERVKNPIDAIYKLILFINGFSVLSDFMLFAVMVACLALGTYFLLFFAIAISVFVYVYALLDEFRSVLGNMRFRYIAETITHSLWNLADRIFLMPVRALCGAYIFLITCVKMAFRSGDLLSWTPFKSTQDAGAYDAGAKIVLPAFIFTCLSAILLKNVYYLLYALGVGLYLLATITMGRKIKAPIVSQGEKDTLVGYAKKIYAYFCDNRDEGLLTDNVQLYPYPMKAKMTSPTNLGFAVLAEVSAAELGLIPHGEAARNIAQILEKIERLKKWHGHLYNWYNIRTFEPMPPYVVSTVDSANFDACLLTAERFAEKIGDKDLQERISYLERAIDYSGLVDPTDKLLCIVYNVTENKRDGKYDLLASEARLAYLIAIGKGASPDGYFRLGRDYDRRYGNTLLSWSGTAFEYMLPRLFVKPPRGSLADIQEENSGRVQTETTTEGVFGRSECGYGDFDNSTSYRYKAVGAKSLAVSDENADVVAPYASFLYLGRFPKLCLANLRKLAEMGMDGEYGFYEAIDFDNGGRIVKSFMTHHQGMSLAAIADYVSDDVIARLFSENYIMRAVRLLSAEEIDKGRPPKLYPTANQKKEVSEEQSYTPHEPAEICALLSDKYAFVADILGRSYAKLGDIYLNKFIDYKTEKGGVFFQVKEGEKISSPTFYPCGNEHCIATIGENSIRYVNPEGKLSLDCYALQGYDGEMRKLTVINDTDDIKNVMVSAYADLMMNTKDAYDSHPAYSDMFVRAEVDESTGICYLTRKNGECKDILTVAICLRGVNELLCNCNRYNLGFGRGGIKDFSDIRRDAPPFGDVLYPCFSATGKAEIPPHSQAVFYFFMLAGQEKNAVKNLAEKLDIAYKTGAIELLGRRPAGKSNATETVSLLGGKLLYQYPSGEALEMRAACQTELEKIGISIEKKIVLYSSDRYDDESVSRVAEACRTLSKAGIPCALVLPVVRVEGAGKDSLEFVRLLAEKHFNDVHVLPDENCDWLRRIADVVVGERAPFLLQAKKETRYASPEPVCSAEILYKSGEGGFARNGYVVLPQGERTRLPYCNVVGGRKGGFVISERGGGFTFGVNAREDKLSVWNGDAVEDFQSERVILRTGKGAYLLTEGTCTHKVGGTSFEGIIEGVHVLLNVYPSENGAEKIYEVIVAGDGFVSAELSLSLYAALGWRYSNSVFALQKEDGITLLNARNGKTAYVRANKKLKFSAPKLSAEPFIFSFDEPVVRGVYRIVLSSVPGEMMSERTLALSRAETFGEMCRNAITVKTQNFALDILYNFSLPYQVQSARLNARTGFYQCSGAYGFRDQLQDVLSVLISDPARCREQLLNAAAHQYEEGDVEHWWHEPRTGVRTRISDDRLWLAYVAEKYITVTGDLGVLDEKIPFLSSCPLHGGEISRYEIPKTTGSAPLSEHMLRAIRISLQYGEHDLLKMGSGDWNDGLDRVGAKGRGESVWLTMFACRVIEDVMKFYRDDVRKELSAHLARMKKALEPLMKEGRYPLCFTDEGEWLGYSDTPKCTISLNPQTWAVLSGAVSKENALDALASARELTDEARKIVKLSAPPFDENSNYGYISAYPKGVRENGGQYTHAAVWYLKALLVTGQADLGYEVLSMLNPIERCHDPETAERYKGEPYVLAGDVYGVYPYSGRAGWTWYTGSAAWLKYTLTEDFFGLKKRGEKLYLSPCFPRAFGGAECTLYLSEKRVKITYKRGKESALFVNGEKKEYVDLSPEAGSEMDVICFYT